MKPNDMNQTSIASKNGAKNKSINSAANATNATNAINDAIVIGSGPSGYTAALYLARARLKVLQFSGQEIGGQLMYTTEIENFPGFPEGVNGPKLMVNMRQQAERFGTVIIDRLVDKVGRDGKQFWVESGGEKYFAKALLITTGAKSRMLGLPGEQELLGRGLSTCAVCDSAFFRDRTTFVIGGGDAAIEDALALSRFTDQVTIIHRRDALRASKIMQERVLENPHITIRWNSAVTELKSENGSLSAITIKDLVTEAEDTVKADGLFYAIGHVPATKFLGDLVQLNKEGYIITRFGLEKESVAMAQAALQDNGRVAYPTMTSVDGIFAAGDNVDFIYRQAVTAAGFGTMAALDLERWLEHQE